MLLLNPRDLSGSGLDARSRELIEKTIAFFEAKGKSGSARTTSTATWYADFLDFSDGREALRHLPDARRRSAARAARWDTWRNCALNEVLGFYGLPYWYTWQVTILGLGPFWMSGNEAAKRRTARLLEEGGIFGFGLSEKEHGADIYSTDMELVAGAGRRRTLARGDKYYIGNGNEAALLSVFGKIAGTDEYVFFVVDPKRPGTSWSGTSWRASRTSPSSSSTTTRWRRPRSSPRGPAAWDAALNTVNVGKYNLGWGSIGIATHALYEAIRHAANRRLYGMAVTDFPHVKRHVHGRATRGSSP